MAAALSREPLLPLIARLQHEHAASPIHPQQYKTPPALTRARRRIQAVHKGHVTTLSRDNTAPLRLHLDFRSLYEEHAPKYSACFSEGAWFKRGLPSEQTPPANGRPTCVREEGEGGLSTEGGCWGKCLRKDLITAEGRRAVIEITNKIANEEVGQYLAVRPVEGNLTFKVRSSQYERALHSKGYAAADAACSYDCTALADVYVHPSYCARGVAADAVLSVTKPPGLEGIAGTGSSCASDQHGRPLWLVFAWHSSLKELQTRSLSSNVAELRALVLHEILHGLGFSHSTFNNAKDSNGAKKNLLALKKVKDTDGAEDHVWHFVRGRAHDTAARFFKCENTSEWLGLPLMGLPEKGRASHWETRVMRDDVMAYGNQPMVSSVTLAALEDLGYYLANYSAAQCMSWGFRQGCEFVRTRCGRGSHDRSVTPTDQAHCRGDPAWANPIDHYLQQKCQGGNNPCRSSSGRLPAFLGQACDAQCYRPSAGDKWHREGCRAKPSAPVELSVNVFDVDEVLQRLDWRAWGKSVVYMVGLLTIVSCIRSSLCPGGRASRILALLTGTFVFTITAAVSAGAAYAVKHLEDLRQLLGAHPIGGTNLGAGLERMETFAQGSRIDMHYALNFLAACTGAFALFTAIAIAGLLYDNSFILLICFLCVLLLALAEAGAVLLVLYWLYSLNGLSLSALDSLTGSSDLAGEIEQLKQRVSDAAYKLLARPLALLEEGVCQSYQGCCKGNATQCVHGTEGFVVDLAISLQDPASANFCPYITGSPQRVFELPETTCAVLEGMLDGFQVEECQAQFCAVGVDGYMSFVEKIVALLQQHAMPAGIACSLLLIAQLTFAVNLLNAAGSTERRPRRPLRRSDEVPILPAARRKSARRGGRRAREAQIDTGDADTPPAHARHAHRMRIG